MIFKHQLRRSACMAVVSCCIASAPAIAQDAPVLAGEAAAFSLEESGSANETSQQGRPQGAPGQNPRQDGQQGPPQGQGQGQGQGPGQGRPGGPPGAGGLPFKPVFDDTWITVGIGAGLVPSYAGSDDYIVFPLPLIVGRVGGVGLRPNGPGIALDILSKAPAGPPSADPTFNFGPALRIRNDRVAQIEDEVVEQLEDLDLAVEVGLDGGVSFPGVFTKRDRLSINAQVRWDVAGAHDGMVVEPSIGYFVPVSRSTILNLNVNLQFVDDNYAEYYFNVSSADSAVTGLPVFTADGGLNSAGLTAILNRDLDGNPLNGGLSIYAIGGYSRLIGDGADTPFTSIRGDANQFIGGIGVAYTF